MREVRIIDQTSTIRAKAMHHGGCHFRRFADQKEIFYAKFAPKFPQFAIRTCDSLHKTGCRRMICADFAQGNGSVFRKSNVSHRHALSAGIALRRLFSGLIAPSRLVEAARVLRDIQSGTAVTDRSLVQQTTVAYASREHEWSGDLYRTAKPRAGLLLVPGAAQLGIDDPRLTAFAQALARAHLEVLVPHLPGLQDLKFGASDADVIADSLSALAAHRACQGNVTVGMVAICYSTAPAMLALLHERVKGMAQFMLAIGGYRDINAVIKFMTTGHFGDPRNDSLQHRTPDDYGKWVFALSVAAVLQDEHDRKLLDSMARLRLADRSADLSGLATGLGDSGRRVLALLENREPGQVPALIAALPPYIIDEIAGLDLSRRNLSQLDMHFTLIHGNDDTVIPETESIALAGVLPRADLFILDSIRHVDPGPAGLGDKLKLLAAVHTLLRQRDKMRAPKLPAAASPFGPAADPSNSR